MNSGYFLGIGSNIDPEANFVRILTHLVAEFGSLYLSKVLSTEPIGMTSTKVFLNAVAFIECKLPADILNPLLKRIEADLGRDQNDPRKREKDRTADIDILLRAGKDRPLSAADVPPEVYYALPFRELTAALGWYEADTHDGEAQGVPLQLDGQELGTRAVRISRDPPNSSLLISRI